LANVITTIGNRPQKREIFSLMSRVLGKGSLETCLSSKEIWEICEETLADLPLDNKKVLVLIPDHTRHAPVDLFFRAITESLYCRVGALDYMVATGTHAAMEPERLYRHVGLTAAEHSQKYPKVQFFNHHHDRLDELTSLGTLSAEEVSRLTGGLFSYDIPITINKKAVSYDHILIVSPVVPHECMGFAGGNKYFFPGIAGLDVVEAFHWLAAVITNPVVNGEKDTPTRRVIDRVVEFLPTPRTCFAFAVDDNHQLACLFGGVPEDSWSLAADYSAKLHIKYLERPFKRVLGITPPIYEEVWVAGKAMYKLETIVADGGELVIYGDQIRAVSFVHGREIERIGYHVRDYFTKQWERYKHEPKLILAHSTNVRGVGSFENGIERARICVSLATGISRELCEKVHLQYRDIRAIEIDRWREDPDTLVVEGAGQVLYRLKNRP
jgi:nickel-dependent lactate racemase